jgi:hypothetical protein
MVSPRVWLREPEPELLRQRREGTSVIASSESRPQSKSGSGRYESSALTRRNHRGCGRRTLFHRLHIVYVASTTREFCACTSYLTYDLWYVRMNVDVCQSLWAGLHFCSIGRHRVSVEECMSDDETLRASCQACLATHRGGQLAVLDMLSMARDPLPTPARPKVTRRLYHFVFWFFSLRHNSD